MVKAENYKTILAKKEVSPLENSVVFFLFISLFCMNLFGRGSIVCLLFGFYAMLKINTIRLDGCSVFTLVLTVSVAFCSVLYYDLSEALKSINFFVMYAVGISGFYKASDKEKYIRRLVFSIFFGYAFFVVVTFLYNLQKPFNMHGQRILYNFWTGDKVAVTLIGLTSSVVIGYSVYSFFCDRNKISEVISIVSMVFVFLVNAKTGTRTPFLIFALSFLFIMVIFLFSKKSVNVIKTCVLFAFVFAVALIISVCVLSNNISFLKSIPIVDRFFSEGVKTSRNDISSLYIKYFNLSLFGGGYIEKETGYLAHNFLQQGYDLYGIFAAIALIAIMGHAIKNMICLLVKKDKKDFEFLFLSMYFAMIIQSCLEPVFTGYPCFLFSFLLLHGTASGYIKSTRVKELENKRKLILRVNQMETSK